MQRALLCLVVICVCSILTVPAIAAESVRHCRTATSLSNDDDLFIETRPAVDKDAKVNYDGRLRVFVVEPTSRWSDYDYKKYHYGFLSFAVDTPVSIPYLETANIQKVWDGNNYNFGNITEDNIMVIAVLYNKDSVIAYSDPPSAAPYYSHYVDAAAAATPGHTGADTSTANSTHTTFIEEGTATWCPYCPNTSSALYTVYNSGLYNFYFAAMVVDVNTYADTRMNAYNLYWLPSCYFDGGYRYHDGQTTSAVTARLTQCGARVVPDVALSVTLTWLGSGQLQVDVSVTNNQYVNASPQTPSTPAGPADGATSKPYAFTTSATDADNDLLYYLFDWGDGAQSEWLGPYASGDVCTGSYAWSTKGSYNVKSKVKDTLGAETGWSQIATIDLATAGDANNDGNVTIGDAVFIVSYVFRGGPAPAVADAADCNCDSKVNIGDAVFLVSYIFRSGPEPGCE